MTQPLPNAIKHNTDPFYAGQLMEETGLRQYELSIVTGVAARTLRQYKTDGRDYIPMPYSVQYVLETLALARRANLRRSEKE